jgi:hypothetical protein
MLFILGTFYATMVLAGYAIEFLFGAVGLIPSGRQAKVMETSITLNYTSVLNIVFLVLAFLLVVRFVRSGGLPMLRMQGGAPEPARTRSASSS